MATSTEDRHALAEGIQFQPPRVVLERLLKGQCDATARIEFALPAIEKAAAAAAAAIGSGHRLAYAGAGSSGLMALADALELAGTFGIPPGQTPVLIAGGAATLLELRNAAEDDREAAAADFAGAGLGTGDAVICVSASGRTPYTLAVAESAAAAGTTVIGVANVAGSPLLTSADCPVLLDTGAEIVAGSTRMGAATAQKITLNMISTLAGISLGHVYDGYMVNLVADNAKLRGRAARIVAAIARVSANEAEAALAASDGNVKLATLVAAGAGGSAEARERLAASDGHLGPALAAVEDQSLAGGAARPKATGR